MSYKAATRIQLLSHAEEAPHPGHLGVELAREVSRPRRPSRDVPEVGAQVADVGREGGPANHAIAPQHGQRIVAALTFRHWRVRLETVRPTPEQLEPAPVP